MLGYHSVKSIEGGVIELFESQSSSSGELQSIDVASDKRVKICETSLRKVCAVDGDGLLSLFLSNGEAESVIPGERVDEEDT